MDYRLVEIESKIAAGNAILFVGAGFSASSYNQENKTLPTASELAVGICGLSINGEITKSENLKYASGMYIRTYSDNKKKMNELITFLQKKLTVTKVSESAKIILSMPWKKFYTTNYDNCIEQFNPQIKAVDISITENFPLDQQQCIHLNGYIKNLHVNSINSSFKLSERSYIEDPNYISSTWYTVFKRDLERASALIFVGYSLYDEEIKKILIKNEELKNNTYFIVKEDCTLEDEFFCSEYGQVLKIGRDKFANFLKKSDKLNNNYQQKAKIQKLQQYYIGNSKTEVTDSEIEKLLILGNYNRNMLEDDILRKSNNYVIYRDTLDSVAREIEQKNIVIASDLGNGKSIFILELLPLLAKRYKNIFLFTDPYENYISDIENITQTYKDELVIFIIDDYYSFLDIFEYLTPYKKDNFRFILTSRTGKHEQSCQKLTKYGISYLVYYLDTLKESEIENLCNLINSIGFWGDKFSSKASQKAFISKQCKSQLSLVLLSLLDNKPIKEKYQIIMGNLINKSEEIKYIIFTGLFLNILEKKIDNAIWSLLTEEHLYDSSIMSDESFIELFKPNNKNLNDIKNIKKLSSLFAIKMIKDNFKAEYTVTSLLKIIDKLKDNNDKECKEIIKNCFKFSTVERILPDKDKLPSIIQYYEKLKRTVNWLIDEPQFWLQYAMGYISFGEYDKAQTYLDNAYGKANKKDFYDNYKIDTQQARLFFLIALKETDDINNAFVYIQKAHKKMVNIPNNRYKFRQLYLYNKCYNEKYSDLSENDKKSFLKMCNSMLGKLCNTITEENLGNEYYLKQEAISQLKTIVSDIANYSK